MRTMTLGPRGPRTDQCRYQNVTKPGWAMALQCRNGSWRVICRYAGKQHTIWVGEVDESEARAVNARVDYWLMRLKQKLVTLPPGCDIRRFLQHDGKPPEQVVADAIERKELI